MKMKVIFLIVLTVIVSSFGAESVNGVGGIGFKTSYEELIEKGFVVENGMQVTDSTTTRVFKINDTLNCTYFNNLPQLSNTLDIGWNSFENKAMSFSADTWSGVNVNSFSEKMFRTCRRSLLLEPFGSYSDNDKIDSVVSGAIGVPVIPLPYIVMTKKDIDPTDGWVTTAYLFNTNDVIFSRYKSGMKYNELNTILSNKYGLNANLSIHKSVCQNYIQNWIASVYGTLGNGRARVLYTKSLQNGEIPANIKDERKIMGTGPSDDQLRSVVGQAFFGADAVISVFYYDKSFVDNMKVVYDGFATAENNKLVKKLTAIKSKKITEEKNNY